MCCQVSFPCHSTNKLNLKRMDFTNLKGAETKGIKFTSEQKQLRKSLYIAFANSDFLQELYSDILERFKKYIEEHVVLTPHDDKDILYYFIKSVKYDQSMVEQVRESVIVEVKTQPLLPPINIASEYKSNNQVLSKMETIGFQHLHVLMQDSSESNTSDSDMGSGDYARKIKRRRTCQRAIDVNCDSLLQCHINKTTNTGTAPHVDILIYMDRSFCKRLSRYLGLIYIEEILEEAEERPFKEILPRLDNQNSKLYRLLQSYINKYLMTGYNNVCLVHHYQLWKNVDANVRAIIRNNSDDPGYTMTSKFSNFEIILDEQPSFLTYVEAITTIIDKALNCKCHVIAKYECGENLYGKVKLSLLSIIPLYILRYFSQCKMLEHEFEL